MDWFERITGFKEGTWTETREQLRVQDGCLVSRTGARPRRVGEFEFVSLAELRSRSQRVLNGDLRVSIISGDVRAMHALQEHRAAVFQVASQFNLLEMVGPDVRPEDGVTRYAFDRTQGPACAIAAGAATIFRNYLATVDGEVGQTADRQLDGLAGVGEHLQKLTGMSASQLWRMRNGYALSGKPALEAINAALEGAAEPELEALRSKLRLGVHWDAEVTDVDDPAQRVCQVFCSALPVAYTPVPPAIWAPFAKLILEAAYEATLLIAHENLARGGSPLIFLTRLGGGAFGNEEDWIDAAIVRALDKVRDTPLDVRIVSFGAPAPRLRRIADRYR